MDRKQKEKKPLTQKAISKETFAQLRKAIDRGGLVLKKETDK